MENFINAYNIHPQIFLVLLNVVSFFLFFGGGGAHISSIGKGTVARQGRE